MTVDPDYFVATLSRLVRTNSINPEFSGGASEERAVAAVVAEEMERLGMEAARHEPEPGRVSVLGRLPGTGGGPSLMLYAHHDTVGVEGMDDPFSGEARDGRVYGRGAFDMKAGLAACLAAVEALRRGGTRLRGDLLIASVADEEVASIGMVDLLTRATADAAIVTEPTFLRVCLAHKGFCWIEVETVGRAAHGSAFGEGIDANMRMGRFLARLDTLERELRTSPPHPLVGPPSLHAAVLQGGTGASTYAERCRLTIERRMVPGETEELVLAQVQAILDALAAEDPTFRGSARARLTRGSFQIDRGAPIVETVLGAAAAVLGRVPETIGEPYWMDTALLAEAGIPTVAIGGSGDGAHAAEEWADVASHLQLAEILVRAAAGFCGAA
ncbi:MAG TPA: M20/M25/M40 family metallo-hydrolase [Longimicrobiaceae bacterium]|nr:M20/M25/M40 family metallo-hydrolase [Longimicrobiaceae bacterium]